VLADAPPGAQVYWLQPGAMRVRVAFWTGGDKGTVFLLPGRTECIEKYGRAAGDLLARGYSVATIDWRGQGLSDRMLPDPLSGHVRDMAEYQADLDALMAAAGQAGVPQPWFVLGHSMGAAIGLRALLRRLPFRAAVFSGPMWGIQMSAWLRPVAWVLTTLAPPFGLGGRYTPTTGPENYLLQAAFEDNVLTKDRDMWDYMRNQIVAVPALALGGPSMAWLGAALRECASLAAQPAPDVPAICAMGPTERVIDLTAVHRRMAGWARGQLDLYPGAEHEIMMETPAVRQRFFDRAAELFDAHR
jgi:lysophospholipase